MRLQRYNKFLEYANNFAQKCKIYLILLRAHTTSKTKDTNSARIPEIIGAFGLVTIYKKTAKFRKPQTAFLQNAAQRYYKYLKYANFILQFCHFSANFRLLRQKCPTLPKIIARKSKPAGYDFSAEVQQKIDIRKFVCHFLHFSTKPLSCRAFAAIYLM